jgi:hypothetical protein
MTDAKGESLAAAFAAIRRPTAYVHIGERRATDIRHLRHQGDRVPPRPYVHELLVIACRYMTEADRGVRRVLRRYPYDAEGLTIVVARQGKAGRLQPRNSAPSTGSRLACACYDRVFVAVGARVLRGAKYRHAAEFLYKLHGASSAHVHRRRAPASAPPNLLIGGRRAW